MQNKRVCFVEVETVDNGFKQLKRLDGLAIKGTVSRKMGTVTAEASISIANLNKSTVEYLTTYTTPYYKPKTLKKIKVYAGYEQTGWGRIFLGGITEALPQGITDVWLNIKAKSLYYEQRTPLSFGAQNITMQDLGAGIAQELGLSFDWQASSTKTIDVFNLLGSKGELIKEYNRLEDVVMFEDNGVLKVVDKKPAAPKGSVKFISEDTGLIGDVEPDKFGIKLKCLLDPSLSCGSWIRTKSRKLPGTDGIYQIYTLDFDFASREQQFYCSIYGKKALV